MRDLMECQAEVFRRSEKRIKARARRRKHMLMTCVPLVFCVSLFFAFLPTWMPADYKGAPEDFGDGQTGNSSGSLVSVYAKIDVTGSNISRTYTKATEVLNISNLLNACMANEPESDASTNGELRGEENENEKHEENLFAGTTDAYAPAVKEYTITLTLHQGGTVNYRVSGNVLVDLNTNRTYPLTQAQKTALNELLGIQ